MPSNLHLRCRRCASGAHFKGMDAMEVAFNAAADGWQITRSPVDQTLIILCPNCAVEQSRNMLCLLVEHTTEEPE